MLKFSQEVWHVRTKNEKKKEPTLEELLELLNSGLAKSGLPLATLAGTPDAEQPGETEEIVIIFQPVQRRKKPPAGE